MPSFFLLLLLLLSPWPSSGAAGVVDDELLVVSMEMDPSEKETLFQVMESMSSDRDWRVSSPEPCKPGEGWPGIECKPAAIDGRMHVSRLDFGGTGGPPCKKGAAFPSGVFSLPYLQSLFFIGCFDFGSKTTLSFPATVPLPPIQQLSLRSNPALVGAIPARISALSATLQVLTLSQNRLHGRIPGEISSLASLVHLDLSYNSLSGVIPSELGGLRGLVGLDLSYNSLSGPIPASIGRLRLLQKLDLSSNSLAGSVPESFSGLQSLSFLSLSDNRLSGDLPGGISELRSLQYFIMDGNPTAAADDGVGIPTQLGRLVKLQELRLAGSGYTGPIPASLASLANLTTLSLENNRLTGDIPAALGGLGRIYHLNLSRNLLSGVVPFNSSFLRRLGRNLDLSGNSGLCFDAVDDASEEAAVAGIGVCGGGGGSAANRSSSALLRARRSAGAPAAAIVADQRALFLLCFLLALLNLYH